MSLPVPSQLVTGFAKRAQGPGPNSHARLRALFTTVSTCMFSSVTSTLQAAATGPCQVPPSIARATAAFASLADRAFR